MIVLFVSCSGEDGVDGATGPQGPAGQDGNANVIASDWFQLQYDRMDGINPPRWGIMKLKNEDIPEVDLVEFVEEGGIVLIYTKIYESMAEDYYVVLPIPTTYGNLTFISGFEYSDSELGLLIRMESPDVSMLENIPNLTFRYVLIPANLAQSININSNNIPETYSEVISLLGIEK